MDIERSLMMDSQNNIGTLDLQGPQLKAEVEVGKITCYSNAAQLSLQWLQTMICEVENAMGF